MWDLVMVSVVLEAAGRTIVGGVLVVAGVSKLIVRGSLLEVVDAYEVLPRRVVRPVALSLPWVEVATGIAILLRLAWPAAAAVGVGLFTAFSYGIGVNLIRGRRDIECGCFGSRAGDHLTAWQFWRAFLLALAALSMVVTGPLMTPSFTGAEVSPTAMGLPVQLATGALWAAGLVRSRARRMESEALDNFINRGWSKGPATW